MPSNGGSNLDRLQEAGLVIGDLEQPYARVVEGLNKHEVDVLVSVAKRLQAADEWHGQVGQPLPEPPQGVLPNFTRCIVF
jgi:hypothetical protein